MPVLLHCGHTIQVLDSRFKPIVYGNRDFNHLGDSPGVHQDALVIIASVYQDKGSYDEAERLYHRALAIREKALGPEQSLSKTFVFWTLVGASNNTCDLGIILSKYSSRYQRTFNRGHNSLMDGMIKGDRLECGTHHISTVMS